MHLASDLISLYKAHRWGKKQKQVFCEGYARTMRRSIKGGASRLNVQIFLLLFRTS